MGLVLLEGGITNLLLDQIQCKSNTLENLPNWPYLDRSVRSVAPDWASSWEPSDSSGRTPTFLSPWRFSSLPQHVVPTSQQKIKVQAIHYYVYKKYIFYQVVTIKQLYMNIKLDFSS